MPGPNNKKKRKAQSKNKNKNVLQTVQPDARPPTPTASRPSPSLPSTELPTPLSISNEHPIDSLLDQQQDKSYPYLPQSELLLLEKPFIYDPGNGPRVRDTRAFLASKFFAQPPAWDVPLCAEFAQKEVLEMIRTVLSEELALILWYNKSRATSRICPACQRLYQLGDTLPQHLPMMTHGADSSVGPSPNPRQLCEQEISGLCSPVCFILAAFNYPGAIQSAWGRMGTEMDEDSWDLLTDPGDGATHSELSWGLGMLVKMTRLYDLGLAQLCFGDENEWNKPGHNSDPGIGADDLNTGFSAAV
ncbi:hypothetical protein Ac2012v2_006069 [Leucoagaricus gongylophorus]